MTAIDTHVVQSIQQAIAIIQHGRALERMLMDAGFAMTDSASAQSVVTDPNPTAEDSSEVPEWPQANADGELVDSRGIGWIDACHSAGKGCNADGTWRRKRGVDPETVEKMESAAMDLSPATPAMSDFDKIRKGLESAGNQDEMDEWWDMSREVIISASQRFALEHVAHIRKQQWATAD